MSAELLRRAALRLRGLSASGCGAPWDPALANLLQLQSAFPSAEESPDAPAYAAALHVARAILQEDQ